MLIRGQRSVIHDFTINNGYIHIDKIYMYISAALKIMQPIQLVEMTQTSFKVENG